MSRTARAATHATWTDEMRQANYELRPLVAEWLLTYEAANASPGTITLYRFHVTALLDWFARQHDRECCTADMEGDDGKRLLERYLFARRGMKTLRGRGPSPRTLQSMRGAIRQFSAWLLLSQYLTADGARLVKSVSIPKRQTRYLSDDDKAQIEALLQEGGRCAERNRVIFFTLLGTGLRRAELVNLRVADARLWKRNGDPEPGGSLRIIGKGDKERRVGVGLEVGRLMRDYYRRHRPPPDTEEDAAYFFLTEQGRRLSPHRLTDTFRRWRQRLGIDYLRPHVCRHTFATNYIMQDGESMVLQELLGHANLTQTGQYVQLARHEKAVTDHQTHCPVDAYKARERATQLNAQSLSRHGATKSAGAERSPARNRRAFA